MSIRRRARGAFTPLPNSALRVCFTPLPVTTTQSGSTAPLSVTTKRSVTVSHETPEI